MLIYLKDILVFRYRFFLFLFRIFHFGGRLKYNFGFKGTEWRNKRTQDRPCLTSLSSSTNTAYSYGTFYVIVGKFNLEPNRFLPSERKLHDVIHCTPKGVSRM